MQILYKLFKLGGSCRKFRCNLFCCWIDCIVVCL